MWCRAIQAIQGLLIDLVLHELSYTASQKHESTVLHKYILNKFLTATIDVQQNIFEKNHVEVGSSHLYTSFGTFCVEIGQFFEGQCSETLNFRKNSKSTSFSFENNDFIVFQKNFQGSLRLEKLTNLGVKCAKRSLKICIQSSIRVFPKTFWCTWFKRLLKTLICHKR